MMPDTTDGLILLGYEARREGRLRDAKEIFSKSVELARAAGNPPALAGSLTGLGQIERDLKNHAAALACYREAVDIRRNEPDRLRFAHTIRHLADILRHEHSVEEASACYEEALSIYRNSDATAPLDLANAVRGFALLREDIGEREAARSLWLEARELYESVQVQAGIDESEKRIARLTAV